ncbi:hypothetical protein [Dorea formicigenerans]|uniref:hypothetical protein n=1 Tax=Dorea formicigenerans TaxID=39486 RepID=UPI001D002884|nr:hypothetical protein [Dorea formicigenerans]MCB5501988.1 hypothetical protein [Dorea formicigenerans]
MKITFNDASEMTIQSATIRTDGNLLIKTISVTEDELRNTFQDEFRTKKMVVTEREATIATYENYTNLNALVKYTGGILGVVMYKAGETPTERMDKLAEANKKLAAENAEISATVDSILTDFLPALFGDVENTNEDTEEDPDNLEDADPDDNEDADPGEEDTKETDSVNTETE